MDAMKWLALAVLVMFPLVPATADAVILSTTYIGEGSIEPPVGAESHRFGRRVTITATPAPGWQFDHWEGDLSGSSPSQRLRL